MKKTNEGIENAIARAVRAIPKEDPDTIWDTPVTRADGSEWFLENTESTYKRRPFLSTAAIVRTMALAAALIAVTFGLRFHLLGARSMAKIYLDINPSISLSIDRRERVANATAQNADGEKVLADMDLKGTDVDVAVNALIGASIRYGYLDSEKAILLLSFECDNKEMEDLLRSRLTVQASDNLTHELGSGTVLDQEVISDDSLTELCATYDISPGKAALLAKIVADHPDFSMETMASMSLSELARYLAKMDVDLRNYTDHHGEGFFEDLYKELLNDVYTGDPGDAGAGVPQGENAGIVDRDDLDDDDRLDDDDLDDRDDLDDDDPDDRHHGSDDDTDDGRDDWEDWDDSDDDSDDSDHDDPDDDDPDDDSDDWDDSDDENE